ncbi:HNH endonuclease signature motif containing protein [Microbacterium sp. 13-71-7]|jgi:5-methylcytosine-specific restriction endonuclease McrA|uniref:HNH endonuclease n=1 Tax=Microbacterium sp. 13-71-7 TaxID=1970399 RepID=UPI000BD037D3|nr:MAG: hypothetical protein B7X32_07575 [Microbacterium sp. 13-71-7]
MGRRLTQIDRACDECGTTYRARAASPRRFCSRGCSSRWAARARRIRHPADVRVRRGQRENAAPGLTYVQRRALLARWKQQRRTCAYCAARPADTIDHVLPLIRGGTNYEGNLAPCCRSCNSSKSGHTVIEWRSGLRLPPMWFTLQHTPRPKRTNSERIVPKCARCGTATARATHLCDPNR